MPDRLRRPAVVAAAIWVAVFSLLTMTGQPYSLRVVDVGWQVVPLEALRANPMAAVWDLHIQPPLWNLLLGAMVAWSPIGVTATAWLVSAALGALLAAAIAATLQRLGAPGAAAVGLTVVATCNTQLLQHAFEPRYDLAVATLLAGLVWSIVVQADRTPDLRSPVVPVALATTLVMVRALYHPVWLVAVVIALLWWMRRSLDRRQVALAVLVPLLLVGGWTVKNEVRFASPALSSWTGMNLLRSTLPAVDPGRVDELIAQGRIDPVAGVGFFRSVGDYEAVTGPCTADWSDGPALGRRDRVVPDRYRTSPFDGTSVPNFNDRCFLDVYADAGRAATALIRAEPGAWLEARAWSVNNWFEAETASPDGASPLWSALTVATDVALLDVPHPGVPGSWSAHGLWAHATRLSVSIASASVAIAVAAVAAIRRRRRDPGPATVDVAAIVTAAILLWTFAAGVLVELGEQSRFRNATDPLVIAVGGWIVVDAVGRRRRDRRMADSEP